MKVFVLAMLAAASLLVVMMSGGAILFSVATSVGTEQDQTQGMKAAGVWLLVASGIPFGWIAYGLRGVWRVVCAAPFVVLICGGLLLIFPL